MHHKTTLVGLAGLLLLTPLAMAFELPAAAAPEAPQAPAAHEAVALLGSSEDAPIPCNDFFAFPWVDECGDEMYGDLEMIQGADIVMGIPGTPSEIIFNGGALAGDPALTYGGVPVCLSGSSLAGCGGNDWRLTGNAGTNPSTNFLGTTDNQPLEIRSNNLRVARYSQTSQSTTVLEGYHANAIAGGEGNTISGGGSGSSGFGCPCPNKIDGTTGYHTIGGGRKNGISANGNGDTIAGGLNNNITAGGGNTIGGGFLNVVSSNQPGTIGGGQQNLVSADFATVAGGGFGSATASYAAVGGGNSNRATGTYAAVPGGNNNLASGSASAVLGGESNVASGAYSLAAGRRATADDQGAFLWADSQNAAISSPGVDTFSVRAKGGIWLGTTSTPSIAAGRFLDTSTGAYLTTGGAWTSVSDRNLKADVQPVDSAAVLAAVEAMPITTWSYLAEPGVRHMGPMAQDFGAAFGLGLDDRHIAQVDADGVALAAIQALSAKLAQRDAQVAGLLERVAALEAAQAQ